MKRLPFVNDGMSFATAIIISRGEMVLEPVRILDSRWCVRRGGRLVPAEPGDVDAFIMPNRSVDDGIGLWPKLSHYLRDRGVFVPGDGTALGDAEHAGHRRRIAVPVEPWRGDDSDAGVGATLARGAMRRAA